MKTKILPFFSAFFHISLGWYKVCFLGLSMEFPFNIDPEILPQMEMHSTQHAIISWAIMKIS